MTVLLALAFAAWITAAPDRATLAARGGAAGAARSAVRGAGTRARAEWARGGPVRAKKRTARRKRMRKSGLLGALAVNLEFAAIRAGKAVRSVGRIAASGVKAAPDGYREGSARAIDAREQRKERRAAAAVRREERFIDPVPVTEPESPVDDAERERAEIKEMAARWRARDPNDPYGTGRAVTATNTELPLTATGEVSTQSKENTVTEINTTDDLGAEAKKLESLAEELAEATAAFAARAGVELEEGVGAANFGTRRIAAAVATIGEAIPAVRAGWTDGVDGLTELRRAVDECRDLAAAAQGIGATGRIEAYAPQ